MKQMSWFELDTHKNIIDLASIWAEFLPYAQKCWQLQRESWSVGNCYDWWKSRFYSCFIGHGYEKEVVKRRQYYFERGILDEFPEFWKQYANVLQSGAKSRHTFDPEV